MFRPRVTFAINVLENVKKVTFENYLKELKKVTLYDYKQIEEDHNLNSI